MLKLIQGFGLSAAVFVMAGCWRGPSEITYPESGATLTGTVSYGKDRVGVALVIAQNDSGTSQAFIDDDGNFALRNVPLGEVTIAVNTDAGKGQAMGKFMAQGQGKAKGAPKIVDVPRKYQNPVNSGIKTTIVKGENHFDVVIPK